jgi:LacI family transcriptional regulator
VLPEAWNREADGAWVSAFIGEIAGHRSRDFIPPLVLSASATGLAGGATCAPSVLATFDSWLQQHRPEVIVTLGANVRAYLALLGLQVPRDFALVDLSLTDARCATAGLPAADERIGELATRVLVGELRHNRRGLPEAPTITLVQRTWIPGESLPCPGWSYEVIDGGPPPAHALAAP